jgi:hypothetical protein
LVQVCNVQTPARMPQIHRSMSKQRSLSFDASALQASRPNASTSHRTSASKRGHYTQLYSKDDLHTAVTRYRAASRSPHPLSYAAAGRPHHVPTQTLRRYIRKIDAAIAASPRGADVNVVVETVISTTHSGNPNTLIDTATEDKLIAWAKQMEEMCIPVDLDMLRLKAKRLHYATHNIALTDENRLNSASRQWWRRLKLRHPDVVLRVPEKLEWLRCRATQPEIIDHFYALLKVYLDRYGYSADQIWAADEVGVEGDNKLKKVVATRGAYTHRNTCAATHVAARA